MSIRDEWSALNGVMIAVSFAAVVPWIGVWIAFRNPIHLLWLIVYLLSMPFLGVIPRKVNGRLAARPWPLFVIAGSLALGSIVSAVIGRA